MKGRPIFSPELSYVSDTTPDNKQLVDIYLPVEPLGKI